MLEVLRRTTRRRSLSSVAADASHRLGDLELGAGRRERVGGILRAPCRCGRSTPATVRAAHRGGSSSYERDLWPAARWGGGRTERSPASARENKSSTVKASQRPAPRRCRRCLKSPTHFSLTPPAVKSRRKQVREPASSPACRGGSGPCGGGDAQTLPGPGGLITRTPAVFLDTSAARPVAQSGALPLLRQPTGADLDASKAADA